MQGSVLRVKVNINRTEEAELRGREGEMRPTEIGSRSPREG